MWQSTQARVRCLPTRGKFVRSWDSVVHWAWGFSWGGGVFALSWPAPASRAAKSTASPARAAAPGRILPSGRAVRGHALCSMATSICLIDESDEAEVLIGRGLG